MALKALITADEHKALATLLQAEYVADGEMFKVDIVMVNGLLLTDPTKIQTALQSERVLSKAAAKATKEAQDKITTLETQLAELSTGEPSEQQQKKLSALEKQLAERYEKQAKAATAALEKERDGLKSKIGTQSKQLSETLHVGGARAAITKAGAKEKLLLQNVLSQTRMVENDDGTYRTEVIGRDGQERLSPKSTDGKLLMSFDELVEEMRADAEFAPAFPASGPGGSGSSSSTARGGQSRGHTISVVDARDPGKYQAARAEANKAGAPLQIV